MYEDNTWSVYSDVCVMKVEGRLLPSPFSDAFL